MRYNIVLLLETILLSVATVPIVGVNNYMYSVLDYSIYLNIKGQDQLLCPQNLIRASPPSWTKPRYCRLCEIIVIFTINMQTPYTPFHVYPFFFFFIKFFFFFVGLSVVIKTLVLLNPDVPFAPLGKSRPFFRWGLVCRNANRKSPLLKWRKIYHVYPLALGKTLFQKGLDGQESKWEVTKVDPLVKK